MHKAWVYRCLVDQLFIQVFFWFQEAFPIFAAPQNSGWKAAIFTSDKSRQLPLTPAKALEASTWTWICIVHGLNVGWKPEKTYSPLEHLDGVFAVGSKVQTFFFESFETLGSVTSNQHETVWRYKGPTHLEMSQTKQSLCHWPHLKRMCKTKNGGNILWKHVWQNQA